MLGLLLELDTGFMDTMASVRPSHTPLDKLLMVFLLPMPLLLGVLTMLELSQVSPMAMVLAMAMLVGSMARERLSHTP